MLKAIKYINCVLIYPFSPLFINFCSYRIHGFKFVILSGHVLIYKLGRIIITLNTVQYSNEKCVYSVERFCVVCLG